MLALVNAPIDEESIETLARERAWEFRRVESVQAACAELDETERASVRAVIVEAEPVDAALFARLPNLDFVGCLRSEPVNVDLAAARAGNIPVVHTPGRNAEAVADFTLGLCLASLRNIAVAHHAIVSHELTSAIAPEGRQRAKGDMIWRPDDPTMPIPYLTYKGHQLGRLVVAVIGFGAVGRAVARRFNGLVAEVRIVDPLVDPELIVEHGHTPCTLDEALAESDVVTIHARSASVIIGAAELAAMKRGSLLINTARATVLDYEALVEALRNGHLGAAALDVFPEEPLARTSPLIGVPRLTLTPHLAGAAFEVVDIQTEIFLEGVRGLYAAESDWDALPVRNPDVREQWQAGRSVA